MNTILKKRFDVPLIMMLASCSVIILIASLSFVYAKYRGGDLTQSFLRNYIIYIFGIVAPLSSIIAGAVFTIRRQYYEGIRWMYMLLSSAMCAVVSKGGMVVFTVTVMILCGGACKINLARERIEK